MDKRAIVYIDGFNFYYGIRTLNKSEFKWLDVQKLAESFCNAGTKLVAVKYFTAKISGDKRYRQIRYLQALTLECPKLEILYGNFLPKRWTCRKCNHYTETFEEKKTDVNIACELLTDAYEENFDVAYLVSGDSDLVTPVERVVADNKKLIVACPPERKSKQLNKVASNCFSINKKRIQQCLLPQDVMTKKGTKLSIPKEWQQKKELA